VKVWRLRLRETRAIAALDYPLSGFNQATGRRRAELSRIRHRANIANMRANARLSKTSH